MLQLDLAYGIHFRDTMRAESNADTRDDPVDAKTSTHALALTSDNNKEVKYTSTQHKQARKAEKLYMLYY